MPQLEFRLMQGCGWPGTRWTPYVGRQGWQTSWCVFFWPAGECESCGRLAQRRPSARRPSAMLSWLAFWRQVSARGAPAPWTSREPPMLHLLPVHAQQGRRHLRCSRRSQSPKWWQRTSGKKTRAAGCKRMMMMMLPVS